MNGFTTINLILTLDQAFDKTIANIARNAQKLANTSDYREIAEIASENAELSEYANSLFVLAQKIIGGDLDV
jgi:hypothetical protein